jgi:hypothetical protein
MNGNIVSISWGSDSSPVLPPGTAIKQGYESTKTLMGMDEKEVTMFSWGSDSSPVLPPGTGIKQESTDEDVGGRRDEGGESWVLMVKRQKKEVFIDRAHFEGIEFTQKPSSENESGGIGSPSSGGR